NGQPLTPIYPWLDARSRDDVGTLRETLNTRAAHARTGCLLHWTYWPAKLTWLRRTQPGLFARVQRWVSFGELLLQHFTNHAGVSVSMASGTGLLDLHSCTWDRPLLTTLGVEPECLSRIVPLSDTAPTRNDIARRWPTLKNVPWLPAVGDGACSNLGAGCTTPDHVAIMIGTSGAERVVWAPDGPFTIQWGSWCYRVDERRLVMGGALNDGGALMDWLHGSLRLPSLKRSEAAIAALAPDSHGLTVLPFWGGERSPGWSDDARGAIVGLRLHTQPLDILRACMEAIALRFGEIDGILQHTVTGSTEIVATGGALLHSPAWMQILADVLDRPVLASSTQEGSSRGASLLALETLDYLQQPLEAIQPIGRTRFLPRAEHTATYRAAAERQRRMYDAVVS
ncbi:MAG TPA: FGGY-family carbohydrate kinase, partial [Chloroflexota bacterium]|nr:FGGY-family carbohydrate kinase [Chloroflexota bacterium]